MKRSVTQVSRSAADTPLLPRWDKKSKGEGLFGTPVDGLTEMPVDTPESQQRQRVIPDTTQRKLEGFCLNTPLTLSQAHDAETPTLVRDPQIGIPGQVKWPAAAAAGVPEPRHRLSNISNLPSASAAAELDAAGTCAEPSLNEVTDHVYESAAVQQEERQCPQLQGSRMQKKKPGQLVQFAAGLFSPPATLPGPGAAAVHTPHPSSFAGASGRSCPGSAGLDADGFVLHMSQTYSRASQPAISPSVAAGLSAPEAEAEGDEGKEAGVSTTPSQDSREPPMASPSNVTFSNATGAVCQQDDLTADQHLPLVPPIDPAIGPSRHGSNSSTTTAFDELEPGKCTPGDALAAPQVLEDFEETTTPELEQIGYSSQDFFGGSQQSAGAGAAGKGRTAAAVGQSGARGAGAVCEEVTAKQMMFPIFRPKAQRKCVILVRHGESEYNSRDTRGKSWSDPNCFDAPLTQKGRQQAKEALIKLEELLHRHRDKGSSLWLSSPLTRALHTMLLAYPDVQHLAQGRHGTASSAHLAAQPANHRVIVLSTIAEQCITVGDVGRPASDLVKQFPCLATQLSQLKEQWWFNPSPDRPNCAIGKHFGRKESKDELRRRVSEFSRWLTCQPEQLVVAFGHSIFWQQFARTPNKLKNCEVHQFWF